MFCEKELWRCPCPDVRDYIAENDTPCDACRRKLKHIVRLMDDPGNSEPSTCCQMRRKVVVAVVQVLSSKECGIGDSELADYLLHGKDSPKGKPILVFGYCPWCGEKRDPSSEMRVTELG